MTKVALFLAVALAGLSGCQTYQPEGRDLWQAVRVAR